MSEQEAITLIQKFEAVSRIICKKWGVPEEWEEFYSEMCCALARKSGSFNGQPFCYIIKVCKNEAVNNYFKGKSICSKPRKGLEIVSIEDLSDLIFAENDFVKKIHDKILVEKIFKILTERERQIAGMIMDGYTETEIAKELRISQQRVNYLKKRIRKKAKIIWGL